jgi:hypothetical protein
VELVADHVERLVEAGGLQRRPAAGGGADGRRCAVFTACVPPSPSASDAGNRAVQHRAVVDRWAGRTISPWFIGMPPISWAQYSENSNWASRASISPNRPSSCSRSAQPATWHQLGIGGVPAIAVDDMLLDVGQLAVDLPTAVADVTRQHLRLGLGDEQARRCRPPRAAGRSGPAK